MTANKHTVQKFMDAFSKSNHADVRSCLADNVEWVIPGRSHTKGKDAFCNEIKSETSCAITVTRMTEENDVVIAEGTAQVTQMDGGLVNTVFCDVFVLRDAKIKHLTAYLMQVETQPTWASTLE